MNIQRDRLLDLIDYVEATERDKLKTVLDVRQHGGFLAVEAELALPGVALNRALDDELVWLHVDRLSKRPPPVPGDAALRCWLSIEDDPKTRPALAGERSGTALAEAGLIAADTAPPSLRLADYHDSASLEAALAAYLAGPWADWASEEQRRRAAIKLYNDLFLLRQALEIAVDTPIELVCGIGMTTLERDGQKLRHPLLTVQMEIALNPTSHAIEVRPRIEAPPGIETEVLDRMELPSVGEWRVFADAHLRDLEDDPLSPFAPESHEPVLQRAAALLDPDARYLPEAGDATRPPDAPDQPASFPRPDRAMPAIGPVLIVSDVFAFFQRERRATQLMDDLHRFRGQMAAEEDMPELPAAVAALLSEPATAPSDEDYPSYRGVSTIPGITSSDGSGSDLFFPKPFNREQVEVVQRLAVRPGVVVQGPPGTGKTHTIANIISHYLALGKRVLVTSQKAPALKVLRDQLPPAVRPLAVSLLDSDRDGLKQFQDSVEIIAARLQRINRGELTREIAGLDDQIDNLHRKLARIDKEVDDIGRRAIGAIELDGERIDPLAAARALVTAPDSAGWIVDAMDESSAFEPQFSDQDIAALRIARKAVGQNLHYLGVTIPDPVDIPGDEAMVTAHRDLAQAEALQRQIIAGDLIALTDQRPETLDRATYLLTDLKQVHAQRASIAAAPHGWTGAAMALLRQYPADEAITALESKRAEIDAVSDEHRHFLTRPIDLPADAFDDAKLIDAIDNQASGAGLGLVAGLFGGQLKARLASIRIVGEPPRTMQDWQDVRRFIAGHQRAKRLKVAWNHAASHSCVATVDMDGIAIGRALASQLDQLTAIRTLIALEQAATAGLAAVIPRWTRGIASDADIVALIETIEAHRLRGRLESAGDIRRDLVARLQRCDGAISDRYRIAIQQQLGASTVTVADFRQIWSDLRLALDDLHEQKPALATVAQVTAAIERSGAPSWAHRLRTEPVDGVEDGLTPGDWRDRWRLRRLGGWLSRIDRHGRLQQLGADRVESEALLKAAYERSIEQRTWLELSTRATDMVRSALAAYAGAIRRIGRGTGKSAARYRRDARAASDRAKGALPCWIMPHYRVSESLPSDLGLFDLVIIDEASQSTLAALPALLRARQILIVGDDKQVSPEHVGLDQSRADQLALRHLSAQVPDYRAQLRQENSLYDLGQVVFAGGRLMLKEHFRCVAPIIEFSKAQFYAHELLPLRLPTASERLDPPLIDILVEDGYRSGKVNRPEADCIVSEIRRIAEDPAMSGRTIGVTTLLGQEQAQLIYNRVQEEIGTAVIERHEIRVGDPTAFQGDERDIMFISLVTQRGDTALSGSAYDQRFNVAASRARNRMILVRSVELADLRPADTLRRALIEHFAAPFASEAAAVGNRRDRCESDFEREMFDLLAERGYRVETQVRVGNFRIDMVVEGENDRRLAIECDGDRYHGPDQWSQDMERQRTLERAGWEIWRCFASRFVRERDAVLKELLDLLARRGISPTGSAGSGTSRHTEHRRWRSTGPQPVDEATDPAAGARGADTAFPFATDADADPHVFPNGRRPSGRADSTAMDRDRSEAMILHLMADRAIWSNEELIRMLADAIPLTSADGEPAWPDLVDGALHPQDDRALPVRGLVESTADGGHRITLAGRNLIAGSAA